MKIESIACECSYDEIEERLDEVEAMSPEERDLVKELITEELFEIIERCYEPRITKEIIRKRSRRKGSKGYTEDVICKIKKQRRPDFEASLRALDMIVRMYDLYEIPL